MKRREFQPADKITCVVHRSLSGELLELLRGLRIPGVFVQPGRSAVLRERRWALDPRKALCLDEDPVEVFRFYLVRGQDSLVIPYLAAGLDLAIPGRGSLYSERVELHGLRPRDVTGDLRETPPGRELHLQSALVEICCIVQRGEANALAKAVLEMGLCVPLVTYGIGLGLRNKLGLVRITIPVEKEVLRLVVSRHDALEAFGYLTDAARLHHPGRGFIYMSPLHVGLINTRIHRGELHHVASMEQVIAAIDLLSRGTDWRRKTPAASRRSRRRAYLNDLENYTLICPEGSAERLVGLAMGAGAGGATVARMHFSQLDEQEETSAPRALESSDLIVAKEMVGAVHEAIHAVEAPDGEAEEIIERSQVEKASSYRHR